MGLLRAGSGGRQGGLLRGPAVWVAAQRGAGGACRGPGTGQAPSHSLTLSLFPLCASLPVGLLHTSFPTYFLVGLSGAFLGNPFYCKMNKRLQNNRRLHWREWACNHNHAATLPPPPGLWEVGRERRRGRKTLGQPCSAGRKARCIPVAKGPRDRGVEPASQPGRSHRPARLLRCVQRTHCGPLPARCKSPGGSRCGEAGAYAQAGAASSALYLQFRWDPLQRKRLDKEAPGAAQPHPNGTMPRGSPAPQAQRSATVLPADRGAAKQCAGWCPQPPIRTRAQKRAPRSLPCLSISPGRGRECSSQPQPTPTTSAWTWGGWEGGRKDEPEPTQDRTWHSAPGEHKPACRSVDLRSESRIQI